MIMVTVHKMMMMIVVDVVVVAVRAQAQTDGRDCGIGFALIAVPTTADGSS